MNTTIEKVLYARVESTEEVQKKYTMYFLNTRTQNGLLRLKYWKQSSNRPVAGDYLKLLVRDVEEVTKELNEHRSVSLDASSPYKTHFCDAFVINEEDVPEELLGKIKIDHSKQIALSKKLLKESSFWKDKKVYNFLVSMIKENYDRFSTAPAAVEHHHNYKGGLFVHTAEVFANCKSIVENEMNEFYHSGVDTDVLFLSAWLHDIGKIEVYTIENDIPKINSEKEKRIGHIVLSYQMFVKNAEKEGLDSKFIDAVGHCILSHHEKREWGAAVEPQTTEAQILCRADFISSRISRV